MATGHESEASLLVDAADPRPVAAAVAALRECAGYALRPRPARRLRDVYVDTPDGALGACRLGLRVRVIDEHGEPIVTLKGKARVSGHRLERLEVEGPLDAGGWEAVRAEAAHAGVSLGALPADGTPRERLARLGLVTTHERTTTRTPRDVLDPTAPGRVRAELVVDATAVRLRSGVARYVEVEIEAKDDPEGTVVDALADALLRAHPGTLRPWLHSKLAVGLTLAQLEAAGKLGPHMAGEWVQPSGMAAVAGVLER